MSTTPPVDGDPPFDQDDERWDVEPPFRDEDDDRPFDDEDYDNLAAMDQATQDYEDSRW